MKKYIKKKKWNGSTTLKRMVNQPEIIEYVKNNPFLSENEIMYNIYGFRRGGFDSHNKKYAECLRRALRSGKISRRRMEKENNQSKFFYFVPEPEQKFAFTEWLTKG